MELNNWVKAAIFAATAIGLGFMFMLVPNIEFISVTIFLSGITLGARFGLIIGSTSMMIYSILNPMGSGLIYLPLLVGQTLGMSVIGLLGAFFRKVTKYFPEKLIIIFSGIAGFICSLWYDGITTIAYPISAGYGWNETLVYAVSGLLFTFLHIISNTLIFSFVVTNYLKRF